jgi:UDP-3-O-acyl N-acetylglucosamine deacetylase
VVTRRTVARTAELSGTGLHTGVQCRLTLEPGVAGRGIRFLRGDVVIPARLEQVVATERRTTLQAGGERIETVEHLLAAAFALGLDDLTVRLDGPEVPILDGSFAPFVALIIEAGRVDQAGGAPTRVLDRPLDVTEGEAKYRVEPADRLVVEVLLDYAAPVIGRQAAACTVSEAAFRDELAAARTFGFLAEVDALRARGLLSGATGDCAIVLSDNAVLNTTLRWPDEFARHKAGDLIGDLALLGSRLAMRVQAIRPSHHGNVACARAIAAAARFLEA